MSLLTAGVFVVFVLLFSVIPFPVLYGISNFLTWLMIHVVKYRKNLVINNLKISFPSYTEAQLKQKTKAVYRNLCDNLVEGIKTFSMSKAAIVKRHKIKNPELLERYVRSGHSIIGVTAHYNNWEWGSLSASLQTDWPIVAMYKPLSNKYIDIFLRKSRSRCGTELASIYKTAQIFDTYKNRPTVYLMAADQSPSKSQLERSYWIDFLGRKTAFLFGIEKYANSHHCAVVYIDIKRVKRGYYEVELSPLCDDPSALATGKLTELYATKVETVIRQQPENWLWTHNRWKHSQD
jgi:KDO2-lipid IV(A) lauroyltransferase